MSELPDAVQAALASSPAVAVSEAPAAPDVVTIAATIVKAVDPAAAPIADAVIALDASGFLQKLEAILAALGHDLPPFWAEAVALAKKA